MSTFDALLRLQDHDTRTDQLRHRLATLPERDAVAGAAAARVALEEEAGPVQARRDELARDQKRVEDDVALVEAKAADVAHRLYDAGITSPKELQALQADLDSLKRRQRQLEDQVLELMEEAEPVDAELGGLDGRRRELAAGAEAAEAALRDAETGAEAELHAAEAARAALVADLPAEQLAVYERLRPQLGGVAVARLVGSQCGGCHLALPAVALEALRRLPPDALGYCDECGRILVRQT